MSWRTVSAACGAVTFLACSITPASGASPPSDFCRPYTNMGQVIGARSALTATLLPGLRSTIGPQTMGIFSHYLARGGSYNANQRFRVDGPEGEQFRAPAQQAIDELWLSLPGGLATNAPALQPPEAPAVIDIADLDPDNGFIEVNYAGLNAPGVLAGGHSGAYLAGVFVEDTRALTGQVRLIPEADTRGVLRAVKMHPDPETNCKFTTPSIFVRAALVARCSKSGRCLSVDWSGRR